MNTFTATFTTSFKYLWRNPVNVTILIGFPIVLILVLGNALSAHISPDTSIEPVSVTVVTDSPSGEFSKFLKSEEISRFLDVEFVDGKTAEKLFGEGEINLIVYEKDGDIYVKKTNYSSMYTEAAISVVESYKQIGAAATIKMAGGGDFSELNAIMNKEVSVTAMPLNKRVPSATDYYAVTMVVMILLYTGMNSMELFQKSLFGNAGDRIRTTPASKNAHIAGLLAASTVTSYLQGMITFVFSLFVYGAYWGENIPLVLVTLFAVVLFSQLLCIFLLVVFRNHNAAAGMSQALFWIMTFFSGGYVKADFGSLNKYVAYIPNSLAHTVIFGSAYGGGEEKIRFSLILLFIFCAVMLIFALLFGRRKIS